MEVELIDIETDREKNSNVKSLPKNSDYSKEQNIGNKMKNVNEKKKPNNKNYIIIIISSMILLFIIILAIKIKFSNNDLIKNNYEKNKGIVELTIKSNDTIKIKKELLKNINSFIACIGQPGSGKSTFGSNYYKNYMELIMIILNLLTVLKLSLREYGW